MIKVSFTGLRERLQTLDRLEREQLPFAAALALTRTAQVVAGDLRTQMQVVFDRPTPATLDSLFIQPATKQKMEARVWIKDGLSSGAGGQSVGRQGAWGKGRAAIKWLTPEVFGGPRDDKGIEALLRRRGVLGNGQYVMPGDKLPLDQYGNVSRGQLNKILSGAKLFAEEGYSAKSDAGRCRYAQHGPAKWQRRYGRRAGAAANPGRGGLHLARPGAGRRCRSQRHGCW